MSIQVHSQAKKGRRRCPALQGWISARDCGEYRLRQIRCPSDCRYLDLHGRYQHARVADDFHLAWLEKAGPYYEKQEHRALDFLMALEFALYQHLRAQPATTDEQVREALKVVARQLGPIHVFEALSDPLAKRLLQAAQELHEQQPQLDPEKAQRMVEALLELFSPPRSDQRELVSGFMGHIETYFTVPREDEESATSIVTPQIITPR